MGDPKFDKEAWEGAYKKAGESGKGFDPNDLQGSLQRVIDKAGLPGRAMSLSEVVAAQKQREQNRKNAVDAELGEDTVVRIKGEGGTRFIDLTTGWEVYRDVAIAYKHKGDIEAVKELLSVFPEHSQLQAELEETLSEVEENQGHKGYDPTVGKIEEVERGNQYDLLPGTLDFREHVEDNELKIEELGSALFGDLSSRKDVTAGDWNAINQTLDNVRKAFGEEARDQVWDIISQKYRDYQDKMEK